MLGAFEYLILTAATQLGDHAYGAAIRERVETVAAHPCSPGALYTTLDRLEQKGFIETWLGDATPERGGRAKRMVRVTSAGVAVARAFYSTITRASVGTKWARPA